MTRHPETIEALKQTGYRLTPQRVMILSAMGTSKRHIGVEEITERVRKAYPYIDVATVYRTLQLLKKLHMVTQIDAGDGSAQYELAGEGHKHLVCSRCGETFDLPLHYLESLGQTLARDFGFHADLEHFALPGTCARCASKGNTGN